MPLPKVRGSNSATEAHEKPITKKEALALRDIELRLKQQVSKATGSWSETDHDLFAGFKAQDQFEQILAAQIMIVQDRAADCFEKSTLATDEQTRRENMKLGASLMSLTLRQIEALDKHRGKGQQTVTVKHLHVQHGGQAIVGNVAHSSDPSKAVS